MTPIATTPEPAAGPAPDAGSDPSQAARGGANVIVLANDPALLEVLKHTLDGRQRVWRAESMMHAADLLLAAQTGVLFIDAAMTTHETPELVDKLHDQFPEAPIIVAGRRDDEAELGERISSGIVFRFLHKPVSSDRVRNFIDAAARRQGDSAESTATKASFNVMPAVRRIRLPRPRLNIDWHGEKIRRGFRAGGAACLLVLLFWVIGGLWQRIPPQLFTLPSAPAPTASPDRQHAAAAQDATQSETARLLEAAGIALTQNRLAEPPGNNAIELYRAVLRIRPDSREARDGLERTADELVAQAQQALLNGDLAAAAGALDSARSANARNASLGDLSAQLQRQREQQSRARQVAQVEGFAAAEEAQARQVDVFLKRAEERMKQGKLTGGPDSAEANILSARELDASEPAVAQAMNALSGRMLLAASEALNGGDVPGARSWLDRAARLGVDDEAVARLRAKVEASQVASVDEDRARLLALANQRIAQGRLLQPPSDSASHYLDLLRASDPDYGGLAETESLLAARLVDEARQATSDRRYADAEMLLDQADADGAQPRDLATARLALDRSRSVSAAAQQVLPEAALERTQHAAPRYPYVARLHGVEGTVEAEFVVAADGSTRDIRIIDSNPQGVFDDAVVEAIGGWHYKPRLVAGTPVDQRVRARLRFQLSGG